ncbi:immunity 49 family protein [Nocardia puris]|uniref:immunity 49 family protein n=1 Tax=Nocardia puris TaxID=208602 RepID=UPI001892E52E|nr:immunity 49 family protein [Nocardia puris]MBF6215435.1 immunity 49 family protein [Nocardia puris]MBF6369125.1 immunity 49 family protein [Nocardia puris]MBF6463326.1 immunity 49 family protein [Nocardia puris]
MQNKSRSPHIFVDRISVFVNAGNWLSAFWLAIVCRDQDKLDSLSDVPIELLRASGQEYDEYVYDWVDTLQSYWAERPGLIEKLTATLQNSDPAVAAIAPRELLDHILYPPINLFYSFIRRGQVDYNDALVEAVNLHKEY